jgi:parallel beta-helix repeat protein
MVRSFFFSVLACLAIGLPAQGQYTVTSALDLPDDDIDDGLFYPATLRSALQNANKKNVPATITISPLISSGTLYLETGLPTANVELYFEGNGVTLAPATGYFVTYGFWVTSDFSTIRNVQIQNFDGTGLVWQGSDGLIELITCKNNAGPGLNMNNAHRNIIGSTLSGYYSNTFNGSTGNGGSGIVLIESDDNIIQYCAIGIDKNGDVKSNSRYGIHIDQSQYTLIRNNVISGNDWSGVYIFGDKNPCYKNVRDNYIGTDQFGTTAKPNGNGVELYQTSYDSIINNVISGNKGTGIYAQGEDIVIMNNRVGTNRLANAGIANVSGMSCGGNYFVVKDNIISGNKGTGISIDGHTSDITNNIIGLDSAQTKAIPNGQGMIVSNRSDEYLYIGDSTGKLSNIIAGNLGDGIHVIGAGVKYIYIVQNSIGANKDSVPFANGGNGILVTHSVNYIDIGNNLISANKGCGIKVIRNVVRFLDTTKPNLIQRPNNINIFQNYIGCADSKTQVGEIGESGIYTLAADTININENYIIGTKENGIFIDDSSHYVTIYKNDLGPYYTENQKVYIQGDGIKVSFADDVLIGSQLDTFYANTIYYSKGHGISVTDSSSLVYIFGNYLFQNDKGGIELDDLDNYFTSNAFNDTLDRDSGSNGLQNTIVMSESATSGNKAEVKGFLTGKPNTTYRIDPYLAEIQPDSLQNQVQGAVPLKWFSLKTDSLGFAAIDTSWRDGSIGYYSTEFPFVTLTASGVEGTSQFSRIIPINLYSSADIVVEIDSILSKVDEGGTVTLVANIINKGPHDAFLVQVRDSVSSEYTHKSVSISKGVAILADSVYLANIPNLKKGDTAVYTVVGMPQKTGLHFRKVYAESKSLDSFPENNSDTISFHIDKTSSVEVPGNLITARLFQVGDNKIRIMGHGGGDLTIRVVNLLGQVYSVKKINFVSATAPIDIDVPKGLVIIELFGKKPVLIQKVYVK